MLFSLKLRSGANQKKKEKDAGAGNKKTRTASWNLLQEILVNYISGNLYNELFRKSRAEKCTVFQSMASPLVVYKNVIKNCSTVLNSPSIFPWSLSLYPLCYLFQKCNDTSAIPHSQATSVHYFVYVFPIFFRYHKGFNNCHLSKNLLTYKFFHWSMCFFIVLLPWRNGVVGFCLKWNNEATSCD